MSDYKYKDSVIRTSNKYKDVSYITLDSNSCNSEKESYNPIMSLVFTYTTYCPFDCKFCYLSKSSRKEKSVLSDKIIDDVIMNIKKYDIPYVDLLGGEPFSIENIDSTTRLMKELNKHAITYHISTTAPDITEEHYSLFAPNVTTSISWHGFDHVNVGLTLNKIQQENRNKLMSWLSENDRKFGVSYVVTELDTIEKMTEFFEYLLLEFKMSYINIFFPNMYTLPLASFYKIAYPIRDYFKDRIKININAPFNFKYSCAPVPQNNVEKLFTGCSAIKSKLEIYKDGTIYPCCLFFEDKRFALGELSNDIYTSMSYTKYKQIRFDLEKSFKKTDKVCTSCNYNTICESCPAKNIYKQVNFTCHGE